ncbi:MAG: sigma-70 family RNA polymerase sigma factor [Clostridia bacterium]|nr:sigma-70 family RNA polymerase sigma factor [Clostridia bacterium]
MQVIIYKFVDGTTNEIEVTDELFLIHLQLVQMEKRNHWRETRRHTSLNYLIENGIDFEDKTADTLAIIIRRENIERVHKALLTLSDKRRELVHKFYYEELTMRQIASQTGVSHTAISQRMKTIRNRLKKELHDYTI